ncbi:MAG: hypothetical protein HQ559_03225 [Lentisphaerae bacterium]|nr:hypothetical protein [Lentisphaerota bacterium]
MRRQKTDKRPLPFCSVLILLVVTFGFVPGVILAAAVAPTWEAFWRKPPPKEDLHLVAYWPMDDEGIDTDEDLGEELESAIEDIEQGSLTDQIMDGANYTLTGDAIPVSAGKFGGAVNLQGKGAIVSAINVGVLLRKGDPAATVEFWVKPEANQPGAILLTIGRSLILRCVETNRIALESRDGRLILHPRPLKPGRWTHVALVRSPLGFSFLVNGLSARTDAEHAHALRSAMRLVTPGIIIGSGSNLEEGFRGSIDGIRISSDARLFYELDDEAPFIRKDAAPVAKPGVPNFVLSKDPLLYAGFDDRTVKVPGVRGNAIDLSRDAARPLALGDGVPAPHEGTIEFWFQPLHWDNYMRGKALNGGDVPWVGLMRLAPAGPPAGAGVWTINVAKGRGVPDLRRNLPWVEFHPGKWVHVICSWDAQSATAYINGERQSTSQFWLPRGKQEEDVPHFLHFLLPDVLLDEIRIYPWSFRAIEARNAYLRFLPDGADRFVPVPLLSTQFAYDFFGKHFTASLSTRQLDNGVPESMTVRILGPDRAILAEMKDVALSASLRVNTGALPDLDFGTHPIEVDLQSSNSQILATVVTNFTRVKPAWWHNTLGKERTVLKPWTPIRKSDEGTLSVWGRSIKLGDGGLPSSITSRKEELLAAPLRLHGKANGTTVKLTGTSVAVESVADDLVEWSGVLSAPGLQAQVQASLEYDGLMSFAVTLKPSGKEPVQIDALMLDIPLRAETTAQMIVNGGGHNFRGSWDIRFIPSGEGRVWDSKNSKPGMQKAVTQGSFCPIIWLGNDERGICFYGENDKGWTPNNDVPSQEILREEGAVMYRMNVISKPTTITAGRQFTFVLHPTPTKPLPRGWRGYQRSAAKTPMSNVAAIDAFVSPTLTAPANLGTHAGITFQMEPHSWEDAALNANRIRGRFGAHNPVMFYMDCSWPKMGSSMSEFMRGLFYTGRLTWTREVEDYMVWIINEYQRRDIVDGLYIDDVSCSSTLELRSTAYKLEDGRTQPGFNTMGFRRFLKRVSAIYQQNGKTPHILAHTTYCFEIPALSFVEMTVNGEDRDIYPLDQRTVMDTWSWSDLRIQGGSEKWGFVTFWKPTVVRPPIVKGPARPWLFWQYRTMDALMAQHDLWYLWCNGSMMGRLAEFGVRDDDVRFVPYWRSGDLATVEKGKLIIVGFYAKPGKAVMMISNCFGQEQEVAIRLNAEKLFPGHTTGVTWKDIDPGLLPPASKTATREEINNLKLPTDFDVMLHAGDTEDLYLLEDGVDDLLSGDTPEEKRVKHLRIRPGADGSVVELIVRKKDYRLIEIVPRDDSAVSSRQPATPTP